MPYKIEIRKVDYNGSIVITQQIALSDEFILESKKMKEDIIQITTEHLVRQFIELEKKYKQEGEKAYAQKNPLHLKNL